MSDGGAMRCPKCGGGIAEADVNMREGVAFCRACDRLWKLRELAADPEEAEADKAAEAEMPAGCWLRDLGSETVIGATCRGPTGCFFLFFAAFWNSITSIFVVLALAGIYRHLGGTLPAWLAGVKGNASPGNAKLGMSIFMLVFMIPFVLVGLGTASAAAIGLFGRLEVTLRGQEGTVFTGVGPIGWRSGPGQERPGDRLQHEHERADQQADRHRGRQDGPPRDHAVGCAAAVDGGGAAAGAGAGVRGLLSAESIV